MNNIESSNVQLSVISSIVNIASAKQISTVAEGVETLEQSNILKGIGCTKVQGYYYSKPKPLEELVRVGVDLGVKNVE